MGSMRRQLIVQLVLSAALLAAVLIFVFQDFARRFAEESQDNVLLASATSILETIAARDGEVVVDIPYAALAMLGSVSDDRVFYRVDRGGAFLTGYENLDLPEIASGARTAFATTRFGADPVRVVTATRVLSVAGKSELVHVTVAQTQDGLSARLSELFQRALQLGLGFFVLASALSVWAANRVFRPISALAGSVTRRGPSELRRFESPVPVEMAPLVKALNDFVERLRRSLDRSEEFITEAAHRVRTPLATVRTQAEVLSRRIEKDENRKTLRQMVRAIDESSRAAGQLFDQAMVNLRTDAMHPTHVDLADCMSDVVTRLQPIAELRDVTITSDLPDDCMVSADPVLLQNAFSNLLDNAIKYTAPETDVHVTLHAQQDTAQISIQDNGPGFEEGITGRLTEGFVRGAAAAGTVGSGLGLTIASQVVEAHGGRMQLSNRKKERGACIDVFLPRLPA